MTNLYEMCVDLFFTHAFHCLFRLSTVLYNTVIERNMFDVNN